MILSATDIVKNSLTITTTYHELTDDDTWTDDHTYIRGDPENRGPCPGLNALCNQNYL